MEAVQHVDLSAYRPTEYLRNTPDAAIRDELKSYLGEYRFRLAENNYELLYFDGHLRDPYVFEPMLEKAQRSIELRELYSKNPSREIAEYVGMQKLNQALQYALPGDRIVWVSPPGNQIDGYGNYGFVFSGTVNNGIREEKHIAMTAFRIEEPSVDAYNEILTVIRGKPTEFQTPEEFLAEPFILRQPSTDPNSLLRSKSYARTMDNKQFEIAVGVLEPLIQQFIYEAKNESSKKRLWQLFHTIENLAIELNENINFTDIYDLSYSLHNNIEFVVQRFGMFKPPVVGGSCGSSEGDESIDTLLNRNIMNKLTGHILSKILNEDEDEYGSRTFTCEECGGKHTRPSHVILTVCPVKGTAMKKC